MKIILLLLSSFSSFANTSSIVIEPPNENDGNSDVLYVIGSKEKVFYSPGSAAFIESEDLKKQNNTDIGRILSKIPGVYIQEEDGLGLRPNIGLRGAHPHRSKKVTLLEDGILIGPAPYSASAAYYFPTPSLAHNVEVFKGPSSVKYGPNSIGGAVNLITRPIAKKEENEIDLSYGTIQKGKLSSSNTIDHVGYRVELHRLQSDGFKSISKGGETGIEKNDGLLKLEYDLGKIFGGIDQKLSLKTAYNTEKSFETYLGSSLDDFKRNPNERYAASKDDLMKWNHAQFQIGHQIRLNDKISANTTVYHNRLKRKWNRFDGLADRRDLRLILADNSDLDLIRLLNGDRDSSNSDENILIVGNDRQYISEGFQTLFKHSSTSGDNIGNDLSFGLRYHHDFVKRNHSEITTEMKNGQLNYFSETYKTTNLTHDDTRAMTVFAENELSYNQTIFSIGTRLEFVKNQSSSLFSPQVINENDETIIVPGIGINHSFSDQFVGLLGINRGVTLVGPGQAKEAKEEASINYEAGFRFLSPASSAEIIGFYSDYSNIKGTCSFSSGCAGEKIDMEFNGGQAEILGVETQLAHQFENIFIPAFDLPLSINYTRTVSRFTADNISSNEEWGIGQIKKGDPLPYVPQDQWTLKAGLHYKKVTSDLTLSWKGKMADQSVNVGRKIIPSYGVIDWSMQYKYDKDGSLYTKVDNLMDKTYLTSLRPYGARGGKPRMLTVGINQRF